MAAALEAFFGGAFFPPVLIPTAGGLDLTTDGFLTCGVDGKIEALLGLKARCDFTGEIVLAFFTSVYSSTFSVYFSASLIFGTTI